MTTLIPQAEYFNLEEGAGKHNPSHIIHDLRFGDIDETQLKGSQEWSNPLKNTEKHTDDGYPTRSMLYTNCQQTLITCIS